MRPENLETSLSIRDTKSSVYAMNDQTFHTPSFGDEEFDIPLIHGQHAASAGGQGTLQYTQLHHSAPQVGMMNPAQDGLSPPGGAPSYQQPLYLQEPHTPVTTHSAGAPAGNYIIQQQPGGQQQLLMMQPTQVLNGPPTPSSQSQPAPVYGSPQRASPPGTTSDDSDDSVPSHHSQLPGDAESLLPIHYCSASRQQQTTLHQMGVANVGVKRSSPEPMDNGMNRGQMQKKPKVQKKKKKRDPNEPQKPVSAYALFFRDTQAAIKGQNPNASFGEVSKIVASMWDGLDSEHKSVYKQKTEVAKKEYLKALAAYRASLVSKSGDPETPVMYNHNTTNTNYGSYYQGQTYGNGHSPQTYVPNSTPQGYSPQNFTGQNQNTYTPAPQNYPNNPQQTPQSYQGNMPHTPSYQGVSGPTPQGYQVNPTSSPQNCQPNITQSPRNYQNAQSPNYVANSAISPQGYRQVQSQSPPMASVHPPMQYHHPQQMQQAHQVQQYQQQQQIQHQQQSQQHQHQQQSQIQQQQTQQMQHQQTQQQHQQQTQQQHHQQAPQQQQTQAPSQNTMNQNDQHSPNGNGNSGVPQQSPEQNESQSTPSCIRQGCKNPAIANSGWEDEYCSNECVVSHCRDVFCSWVASNTNNQMQNFSAVK